MSGNKLVYWLGHLGEGTWEAFRKAVEQLAEPKEHEDDALPRLIRTLRFRLSDLGFLDFLLDKRKRWQVPPPVLASFPENRETAILCGGRSPDLVAGLKLAAATNQCSIRCEERPSLPDHIIVTGQINQLEALAASTRIRLSADFAQELIEHFVTIESLLAEAQSGEAMIGWRQEFFDLQTCRWTADRLSRTVCKCASKYGRTMTFLQISRTKTVVLPGREAIYGAAMLSGTSIVSYDAESKTVSVPMSAPLPDACARLACISSGKAGTIDEGLVRYAPVPPRVARIILASLGQNLN